MPGIKCMCIEIAVYARNKVQLSSKGSGEGQEEKVFLEIVMDKAF